tara:strand:+ start:61402 stop:61689 length:288 start_codon:yes stop_codon:yes gene_type:complete
MAAAIMPLMLAVHRNMSTSSIMLLRLLHWLSMQGLRTERAYRSILSDFFEPQGTNPWFDGCIGKPGVATPSHFLATPASSCRTGFSILLLTPSIH